MPLPMTHTYVYMPHCGTQAALLCKKEPAHALVYSSVSNTAYLSAHIGYPSTHNSIHLSIHLSIFGLAFLSIVTQHLTYATLRALRLLLPLQLSRIHALAVCTKAPHEVLLLILLYEAVERLLLRGEQHVRGIEHARALSQLPRRCDLALQLWHFLLSTRQECAGFSRAMASADSTYWVL